MIPNLFYFLFLTLLMNDINMLIAVYVIIKKHK